MFSAVTAIVLTGFGSFFADLKRNFQKEELTTTAPPPVITTVPYERPDGIHAAPDGHGKMLALTFDDGPGGKVTNHILDTLEQAGGKATFFCLGDRAQQYQKTLKRIVASGCEVASHSYSHERLTRLSSEELEEDLSKTCENLEENAGLPPQLLRPPYGSVNDRMRNHTEMPIILWSIDSEDWRYCEELCKNRSEEQREQDLIKVANSVLDYVQDGDIILMHDLYSFTQDVADTVIAELSHKGWKLMTVSGLFEAKGIELEPGEIYHAAR
jgi:peptidoglycan/xylan/chitin deacetylase (PgdA/CDA1 family)